MTTDTTLARNPQTRAAPGEGANPGTPDVAAFDSPIERELFLQDLNVALFGATQRQAAARIGRFSILRKLGHGGMGVVFLGYDEQLDRKAAIKLLRTGSSHPSAHERMLREAQALARISHPNVVQIYETGIHDGSTFIAMEFIAGQTLGEWMEGEHGVDQRLAVFRAAGRGLEAAHAAGLVHRDFKPDNVMLAADGQVKVMDFGLVRSSEDQAGEGDGSGEGDLARTERERSNEAVTQTAARLTQTGMLLGTPAYMAPEQHLGQSSDARADQFSFCVALWEALYGERPFPGASFATLTKAVLGGHVREPPRAAEVPAWQRAVLERGLAREPELRWASMKALLDALDNDRPRRRRRNLGIGLAAALTLALGWGAAGLNSSQVEPCANMDAPLVGVWDDEQRARLREALGGSRFAYAAQTAAEVERGLDRYASDWAGARMGACESHQSGGQSDTLFDLRMRCFDERLTELEALVGVLGGGDEAVLEGAVRAVDALAKLDRCADVDFLNGAAPPPEDPDVAAKVSALSAQVAEVKALTDAGSYVVGRPLAVRVVREARALDYEPLLVRAELGLGRLQNSVGEFEAAELTLTQAYERSLGIGLFADAAAAARLLVYVVGYKLVRPDDARRWSVDAAPLTRVRGTQEELAELENNLGVVANSEGKYEEARAHYTRAFELRLAESGDHAFDTATSMHNLGVTASNQSHDDEARDLYERALAMRVERLGPEHPAVSQTLNALGLLAREQGRPDEAKELLERSLAIREQNLPADHPDLSETLTNLGMLSQDLGDIERSQAYYDRSLVIMERGLGPNHPNVAKLLNNMGILLASTGGDLDQAGAYFERALAIVVGQFGPDHAYAATYHNSLGNLAMMHEDWGQARIHFERSLAIHELTQDPNIGYDVVGLGDLAVAEGDTALARRYYRRSLEIWTQRFGPTHPHVVHSTARLGNVLLDDAAWTEAIELFEQAVATLAAGEVMAPTLASARFGLARALWAAQVDQGRDRLRARELAAEAREALVGLPGHAEELAQVESWLASRR